MTFTRHSYTRTTSAITGVLALACGLAACQAKAPEAPKASVADLANKTRSQLVAIKGGSFKMGDFGDTHSEEKLPYTGELDDGPVHEVKLDDFSMSKYKVTVGDYDVYTAANGLPSAYMGPNQRATDIMAREHPKIAMMPVGVDWQDAKNYCQWIGKQIGLNMDLPTEAEWEYAARARGKEMIFATNNGEDQPGVNFASFAQMQATNAATRDMPVGMYPPTPLGLYDMASNGYDWTNDWYDKDYYSKSPVDNPQGPPTGTRKVIRGSHNGPDHAAMTFARNSREPALRDSKGAVTNRSYGFRCVARPVGKR
ncbi:formylglycine-generating enzyme family protein [Massilia sp. PAMC28688]|uniref:formylglycine-generating enzyme family protein n=1 Tax=Massilia sp. PAMC28688 TaxID=2861283 RepID=UPI001C624E10|nr:SUMF1/EgtB/PvdO family nonheme iron enzyme [Massilia sp. PAMC28688]QYF93563.1 formylglycine-generating enzyme family protein [Massilia sp. PAMC28688]